MRSFTVLDLDHETGITVLGGVEDVNRVICRPPTCAATLRFTRVFWTNPDDLGDDEWSYDEQPVYIRPEVVRMVSGLPKQSAHALERARVEAD